MDAITSNHSEKQSIITIKGRLNLQLHQQFRASRQHQWLGQRGRRYTLDFSELDHIDSSGLGMLLLFRDEVGHETSSIEIVKAKPEISRLLTIANYDRLFTIQ